MNKIVKNILLLSCLAVVFASCDDFVFGNVHVDYNENPLESKGLARSGADRYVDSLSKIKVSEQETTLTQTEPSMVGPRVWPCLRRDTPTVTV